MADDVRAGDEDAFRAALSALADAAARRGTTSSADWLRAEGAPAFEEVIARAVGLRGGRAYPDARLPIGGARWLPIDEPRWVAAFIGASPSKDSVAEVARRTSLEALLRFGPELAVVIDLELAGLRPPYGEPMQLGAGTVSSLGEQLGRVRYREEVDVTIHPVGAGATESPVDDAITRCMLAMILGAEISVSMVRTSIQPIVLAGTSEGAAELTSQPSADSWETVPLAREAYDDVLGWGRRLQRVPVERCASRLPVSTRCATLGGRQPRSSLTRPSRSNLSRDFHRGGAESR